jgi:hypothetical protein
MILLRQVTDVRRNQVWMKAGGVMAVGLQYIE